MPTNTERTEWARTALDAHGGKTGNFEDVETRIGDLICDIAHLADDTGVDILATIKRGLYHHAAERGEMENEGLLFAEHHPDYGDSPHARMWVTE